MLIVAALGLGLVLAQLRPATDVDAPRAFALLLWQSRRADLMVVLGLMLVGSLGIRSLLPSEDEDEEEAPPYAHL
jgi:hypothetical protein